MRILLAAIACLVTAATATIPAGAGIQIKVDPLAELPPCTGINTVGHADHAVTADVMADSEGGWVFDTNENDAAHIKLEETETNAEGIVTKWFYRLSGKSSEINCDSPIDKCPEGPEVHAARVYADEILAKVDANDLDNLPMPPLC